MSEGASKDGARVHTLACRRVASPWRQRSTSWALRQASAHIVVEIPVGHSIHRHTHRRMAEDRTLVRVSLCSQRAEIDGKRSFSRPIPSPTVWTSQ